MEPKTQKNRWIWILLLVVALLCVVVAGFFLIRMWLEGQRELDRGEEPQPTSSTDTVTTGTTRPLNYVDTPIDWEAQQAKNPHIYGWISLPGANVDYPLLCHDTNDQFYLDHSVEGETSRHGSIYTHLANARDMSDFNTVIYGHNMKDGTMFGSLRKFRQKDFFEANREIVIYQPGRILKYKVFAAYVWDDRDILYKYNFFVNPWVRSDYLDTIFDLRSMSANIDKTMSVTADDHIITLSTCTNNDSERYLVQGVLVYDSRESG